MANEILNKFYTGFLGRDVSYVVFGSLPWIFSGYFEQFLDFYDNVPPYYFLGASIGAFYLSGFFIAEIFTVPRLVKTNASHGFRCRNLRKLESFVARGDTALRKELRANYYAYHILLERHEFPLSTLTRIVFLKHMTSTLGPCLSVSLILYPFSVHWVGPTGGWYCASIFLAMFAFALNWYFWRDQFATVDMLLRAQNLYEKPGQKLHSPK